ncbi:unnamed protein product [Prunus armeniaca]
MRKKCYCSVHTAAILSINAVEHWLGIGAADNSIGLKRDLVASQAREQKCLGGNYTKNSCCGEMYCYGP